MCGPMDQKTILVVEDDAKVRKLLRSVLEEEGFCVLEAGSAVDAMEHLRAARLSLITLDINLGPDSGIELAREIRKLSKIPIIMVSGKDDVIDRVVGLEVGADDYITKPFHNREVVARVRSVLRRAEGRPADAEMVTTAAMPVPTSEQRFEFDGIIAIPDQLLVLDRDGLDCKLTSGDLKLLMVFLERPKRVLSRDQLMDLTGGGEWSPLDRTIDNQVARLRKKIERDPAEPKLIKTVRGIGYSFTSGITVKQPDQTVKSDA